jgi:RNA polymerase sigma-54 factor
MMTRQIRLALHTLQLSRSELVDEVHRAVQENPVLVSCDEHTEAVPEAPSDADRDATRPVLVRAPTLRSHLSWQASMSDLNVGEKRFAELMIARLNDQGYLDLAEQRSDGSIRTHAVGLELLANEAGLAPEDAPTVLKTVHGFDPLGVAARNRRQCLLIQASAYGFEDRDPEIEIIKYHLDALDTGDASTLAHKLGLPLEETMEAMELVRDLEDPPARRFSPRTIGIVADVRLIQHGHDFAVVDNDHVLPRLATDEGVAFRMLQDPATKERASAALRQARALIRAIDQRNKAIVRVAEYLVERQLAFFLSGADLEPLIVPEVAEAVGMSESTVARVVTNKYLSSPSGLIELKALFLAEDQD